MLCFNGMYRTWGLPHRPPGRRGRHGHFRNCAVPSSCPEVAAAGLHDCVSGSSGWRRTLMSSASTTRIIVAGESGGGNLTLATGLRLLRDGEVDMICGL